MTTIRAKAKAKQIPFGNDNKKAKGKGKGWAAGVKRPSVSGTKKLAAKGSSVGL
jgi:hypothetical protein